MLYLYDNDLGDANTVHSWGRLRKAEVTGTGGQGSNQNAHFYQYDVRGMLLQEQVTSAATGSHIYETSYSYDTGGRLKSDLP